MEPASGGTPARTWTRTLFPSANAPAEARWFLWSSVGNSGPVDDMETAVLLLSEVVSNAVRHGARGRAIKLSVTRSGPALKIRVRNDGRFRPPPMRRAGPGGWGLVLIQQLASQWGLEVGDDSVETWFEVSSS